MFIDTNVFLRHFLRDHASQSPRARALFAAIGRGEQVAWTTWLVVAELAWVLSSRERYGLSRTEIAAGLTPALEAGGIHLPDKDILPRVFELWSTLPIDFADAYHAALIERRGEPELYSFDRDFDRIPTLSRREP